MKIEFDGRLATNDKKKPLPKRLDLKGKLKVLEIGTPFEITYRAVKVPACGNDVMLTMNWKSQGESGMGVSQVRTWGGLRSWFQHSIALGDRPKKNRSLL